MSDTIAAPGEDPELAALYAAPFTVLRPALQTRPFVFASPHSGRFYPTSFIARSRLSALALRRSEDAFVEELFASVVPLGAPLIAARFPRAYVDANRAPSECDASMFESPLPFAVDGASPRVNAGLGVIPRIVRDGAEIYQQKLSPQEAERRLSGLYRPYHAALAQLLAQTQARFGYAILIDCHSMPSVAAIPDMVLGDRQGISASAELSQLLEAMAVKHRFSVVRNTPYAGGYTTFLHGLRTGPVQAIQIEINRGLYLHEERLLPSPGFGPLRVRLADFLRDVIWADLETHGIDQNRAPGQMAAE